MTTMTRRHINLHTDRGWLRGSRGLGDRISSQEPGHGWPRLGGSDKNKTYYSIRPKSMARNLIYWYDSDLLKKMTKGDTSTIRGRSCVRREGSSRDRSWDATPGGGWPGAKTQGQAYGQERRMEIPIETNRKHYTTSNPADLCQQVHHRL